MNWKGALTLAVLAVSCLHAPAATVAGVVVVQVEAPETETGLYAPVDFARRNTASGGTLFPNQRFFAVSGTTTTGRDQGVHARDVGLAFYGASTPGGASITDVYVMTSGDFLGKTLLPTRRGRLLPLGRLPGRASVVNASFSGSQGSNAFDAELLKRADTLVSRDSVVLVAGAVTAPSGPFAGARLLWASRNAIAVRGDASDSIFDPSALTTGRLHADLWDSGTASLATARVSSAAAALVDDARNRGRADLAQPHAVRAALLVSADRGTRTIGGETWGSTEPNGLSRSLGAGKLDAPGALELMQSPDARFVRGLKTARGSGPTLRKAVRTGQTASAVTVLRRAVGTLVVGGRGVMTSLFRLDHGADSLAAALTWPAAPSGATGDLRIELRTVTLTPAGDAVLGELPLLSADAERSNVRFLVAEQTFEPGLYAWVIRNDTGGTARPAIAWEFGEAALPGVSGAARPALPRDLPPPTSIPEPSSVPVLAGLAVLLRRRPGRRERMR